MSIINMSKHYKLLHYKQSICNFNIFTLRQWYMCNIFVNLKYWLNKKKSTGYVNIRLCRLRVYVRSRQTYVYHLHIHTAAPLHTCTGEILLSCLSWSVNGIHVSERCHCTVCRDLLLVYMYRRGATVLFVVICNWYTCIEEVSLYCLPWFVTGHVYMYRRGVSVLFVVICYWYTCIGEVSLYCLSWSVNGIHVSERCHCTVCRDLLLVYMYRRGVTVLFVVIWYWYTCIREVSLYCLSWSVTGIHVSERCHCTDCRDLLLVHVYMYPRGVSVLFVVICKWYTWIGEVLLYCLSWYVTGIHVLERCHCTVCRDLLLVYMYRRGVTVLFVVICYWYTCIGEVSLYCLSWSVTGIHVSERCHCTVCRDL